MTSFDRRGLTIVEVVLVIAIIGILLALLLGAVFKVREAAYQLESKNNVRQLLVALHSYAGANQGKLPVIPRSKVVGNIIFPIEDGIPSLFIKILPFLEQNSNLADPTSSRPIRLFISPADPTAEEGIGHGISSYAANAYAFHYDPRMPATFSDGTSNTITFAEHYAYKCSMTSFFYWNNNISSHRATFADVTDVVPITQGNPPVSQPSFPGDTFQVAPLRQSCTATLAQTPHRNGMVVGMADGSVRIVAGSISSAAYWAAVTPAGGEMPGNDW